MMKRCFDGENGMIDFNKEHSEAWLELMAAYARMALKKIKRHPERTNIADEVLLLAEA